MSSQPSASGQFLSVPFPGGAPIPIGCVAPDGSTVFTGHLDPDGTMSLADPTTGDPIGTGTFANGNTVLVEQLGVAVGGDGSTPTARMARTVDVALAGTSITYTSQGRTYDFLVGAQGPQIVGLSITSDGSLQVPTASGPTTVPAGSVVTYDLGGNVMVNGTVVAQNQPLLPELQGSALPPGAAVPPVMVPPPVQGDPADPLIPMQDGSQVTVSQYVGSLSFDIDELNNLADALDRHASRVNDIYWQLRGAGVGYIESLLGNNLPNNPTDPNTGKSVDPGWTQAAMFQINAPDQIVRPAADNVYNTGASLGNVASGLRQMASQLSQTEQQNVDDIKNQDPLLQVQVQVPNPQDPGQNADPPKIGRPF